MLTPTAFATLAAPVAPRSTLEALEARLAVLDELLSSKAPQAFHVTLEPHPYAFGAPLARAVDWEAFGHAVLGTTTVLPNDSRWAKGGVR